MQCSSNDERFKVKYLQTPITSEKDEAAYKWDETINVQHKYDFDRNKRKKYYLDNRSFQLNFFQRKRRKTNDKVHLKRTWLIFLLLGVQISSVRFPKDSSSCCEWFIVTADFGGFREVKHLLIIFSLYRFEFISLYTKTLIFTVFEMSNFVLSSSICGKFWFSALIGRKVRLKPIECLSKFMVTLLQLINHVGGFDVSRMEISMLKTSFALDSQKIWRQRIRGITRRRVKRKRSLQNHWG